MKQSRIDTLLDRIDQIKIILYLIKHDVEKENEERRKEINK